MQDENSDPISYLITMMRLLWILLPLLAMSCTTVSKLSDSQLTSGRYFRVDHGPDGKRVKERVYVEVEGDSIETIPIDDKGEATGTIAEVADGQVFLKPSFDIDVMVIVFKYRPELPSLPSQLTTDFNGNLFLGYRKDWFTLRDDHTPLGRRRKVRQKSIAVGGFGGLGTTFHQSLDDQSADNG